MTRLSRGAVLLLLGYALMAGGCATTSSPSAAATLRATETATATATTIAPEPSVVVLRGDDASVERDALDRALAGGPYEALASDTTCTDDVAERALLARVEPLIDHARRLYRDLAFDESLATAGQAQVLLEEQGRTRAEFDALEQAFVLRGMNELALGREELARAALREAARLRPEATLDEGRVPPDARALYEAVRLEVRAAPPLSLALVTHPAGASVTLDGEPIGAAPLTLRGSAGRHWLRIEAPGFSSRALPVDFAQGAPALDVTLPSASRDVTAAAVACLDDEAIRALSADARRRITEAMGTSLVAVTRRNTIAFMDLARGQVDALGLPEQAVAADVRAVLDARREHERVRLATPAAPPSPNAAPSSSVLRSPWFWVVSGAAVVTGVVVTALIVTYEPTPIVQVSTVR